jgi:hypothetical protein
MCDSREEVKTLAHKSLITVGITKFSGAGRRIKTHTRAII